MSETAWIDRWLTTGAAIAAIAGAIFAWWSAASARRQANAAEGALRETCAQSTLAYEALEAARTQNEIAIHGPRLNAYKALLNFRMELNAKGWRFEPEAVWHLWEQE